MPAWGWVVLIVGLLLFIGFAIGTWISARKRRTERLRGEFGSEYEATLMQVGSRGKAEDELQQRRERVIQLQIRPLSAADVARFSQAWQAVQAHFVDDPGNALGESDRLV